MLEGYDKYFGGARGAAEKALKGLKKSYGPKTGQIVWDARVAKQRRRGKKR